MNTNKITILKKYYKLRAKEFVGVIDAPISMTKLGKLKTIL